MARRFGGPNGYGHLPDPEGHMRTSVEVLLARVGFVSAAATPPAVSHRAFGPGVFDQGPTSSCTGHAVSGSVYTTLGRAGTPIHVPPSPRGAYTIGRCIDRVRTPDGSFPRLEDGGTMPNQVMRGVTEFGVPALGHRPPDGRFSDADPNTINDEPDLGMLEDASDFELQGEYFLNQFDPNFIVLVRAALAAGLCICFSTYVDTQGPRSVEGWAPASGPLGAPNRNDKAGGWHYLYADGYRTLASGITVVEFPNSWGQGWGAQGYGEGDEAFARGWTNVVAMKVARKEAA